MNNQDIITKIKRILSGRSTKEEEDQVNDHFYQSFQSQEWDEMDMGSKKDLESRIISQVTEHISPRYKTNYSVFNRHNIFRYAAAILILLGIGFLFYPRSIENSPITATVTPSQLIPGRDIASLELSDGTVIPLTDLAPDKQYQNAGVTIRKNSDGNLTYIYDQQSDTDGSTDKWNTLRTPKGGKYQIELADGTKVWLNAGSSLTFPERFATHNRLVKASGEVYFEVSHDKTRPFIVNSNDMEILVLGTSFNLSNYDDNPQGVSVALLEGAVKYKTATSQSTLRPGQKVNLKAGKVEKTLFDIESEIAWKNDYFIFKDQNIKQIMNALSRWYNAEIEYEGNAWEDKNFTIRVSRRQEIADILEMLELTHSIKFKIIGRRIIVST
ncbi:FecR family protein [Sphingobacterium sp. SYP-B4668]|uniref:FecR family protein n=1 Tax=Sphingobacterium sp. SYP-B4668 TaxID=2996035 RepID=UPI0022DDF9E4|nr:FecR domain-containing protein [Sphingobacterium sp. SYP-B4668]